MSNEHNAMLWTIVAIFTICMIAIVFMEYKQWRENTKRREKEEQVRKENFPYTYHDWW